VITTVTTTLTAGRTVTWLLEILTEMDQMLSSNWFGRLNG
jgi:hypothetical protein